MYIILDWLFIIGSKIFYIRILVKIHIHTSQNNTNLVKETKQTVKKDLLA